MLAGASLGARGWGAAPGEGAAALGSGRPGRPPWLRTGAASQLGPSSGQPRPGWAGTEPAGPLSPGQAERPAPAPAVRLQRRGARRESCCRRGWCFCAGLFRGHAASEDETPNGPFIPAAGHPSAGESELSGPTLQADARGTV